MEIYSPLNWTVERHPFPSTRRNTCLAPALIPVRVGCVYTQICILTLYIDAYSRQTFYAMLWKVTKATF